MEREPDPSKAYDDAYFTLRIRWFENGQMVAEHHMSESLENDWGAGKHPGKRPLFANLSWSATGCHKYQLRPHRKNLIRVFEPLVFSSRDEKRTEATLNGRVRGDELERRLA